MDACLRLSRRLITSPITRRFSNKPRLDRSVGGTLDPKVLIRELQNRGRRKEWREALELLKSSKDAGLPMTVQIYGATVTALSRSARQKEAKSLVLEAEGAGIAPDVRMLTDLIDPRCGPSTVEETLNLLQRAKVISGSNNVDSQLLCAAAASLNEAEGWNECLEVLVEMKDKRMGPDGDIWRRAEVACKDGGPKNSIRLWIEAARKQCRGAHHSKQQPTENNEYVSPGKLRRTRKARHGLQYKMTRARNAG